MISTETSTRIGMPLADSFLDDVAMAKKVGVPLIAIYGMEAAGTIPAAVVLQDGRQRWLLEEVNAWIFAGRPEREAWRKKWELQRDKKGESNE